MSRLFDPKDDTEWTRYYGNGTVVVKDCMDCGWYGIGAAKHPDCWAFRKVEDDDGRLIERPSSIYRKDYIPQWCPLPIAEGAN